MAATNAASGQDLVPVPVVLLRIWLLTLPVFCLSFSSLEAYWRSQGFQPSVPDSKDLWYFWRQRVNSTNGKSLVLLGTSRIQTDVSLEIFEREFGIRPVQLGVTGQKSPIGALQDLAADPQFCGVVLCSLFVPLIHQSRWDDVDEYLLYRPRSRTSYIQSIVTLRVRSVFTVLNAKLSLGSLVRMLTESGHLSPWVPISSLAFDRQMRMWPTASEANPDFEQRRAQREFFKDVRVPTFNELLVAIESVRSSVEKIRSRGGSVVFIQLPSSGEELADEEKAFPKRQYWDRFAQQLNAPCLHFQDVPTLCGFKCPDGVHLSEQDVPRFTEALAHELKRLNLGSFNAVRT